MSRSPSYEVIVIGTSAGGLFALSYLLEELPADYPLPLVIVQHRIKDQQDLLEELLQNRCRIKIRQANEKERIENGTVYTAPPDYHLLVESDKSFSLSVDNPVRYSRPSIDVLFETAAVVFREGLVGIILTGANNDGAAGIIAIRQYGGLTIVQDPGDAQFSAMPEAAIATKEVNHIWTLQTIRNFLLKIADA